MLAEDLIDRCDPMDVAVFTVRPFYVHWLDFHGRMKNALEKGLTVTVITPITFSCYFSISNVFDTNTIAKLRGEVSWCWALCIDRYYRLRFNSGWVGGRREV